MDIYYHPSREGQESRANFSGKIAENVDDKNECFATFSACENSVQTPDKSAVAAATGDGGLVYGDSHTTTLTKQQPFITNWYARRPDQKRFKAYVTDKQKHVTPTIKKTKAWTRLDPAVRDHLTRDYAFRSESLAFSLNLTPKRQAQLRKSDRPAKMLADAINRVAKRELGYAAPISLALEVTTGGRLHAHGIVTLQRGEGAAFCKALKSAGGKVDGFGAGRQTDVRRLWSADGWAGYIAKAFDQTVAALGTDKIVYQCRATVAGARGEYEASLARQKAARRKTQGRPRNAKKAMPASRHLPTTNARQRPRVMVWNGPSHRHRGCLLW